MIPAEIDLDEFSENLRQVINSHILSPKVPELEKYLLTRIKVSIPTAIPVLEDTWGKIPDSTKTADLLFQQIIIYLSAGIEIGHMMKNITIQNPEREKEIFKGSFEEAAKNYISEGKLFRNVQETVEVLQKYIAPFVIWWIETEFVESVTDPTINLD